MTHPSYAFSHPSYCLLLPTGNTGRPGHSTTPFPCCCSPPVHAAGCPVKAPSFTTWVTSGASCPNFPIRIYPPCSQLRELLGMSGPLMDSWQRLAPPPHHCVRLKASPACLGLIHFHTLGFLLPPGSCLSSPKASSPARLLCLLLLKSSVPCVHGRAPLDLQLPLICRAGPDIKALPKPPLIVPP